MLGKTRGHVTRPPSEYWQTSCLDERRRRSTEREWRERIGTPWWQTRRSGRTNPCFSLPEIHGGDDEGNVDARRSRGADIPAQYVLTFPVLKRRHVCLSAGILNVVAEGEIRIPALNHLESPGFRDGGRETLRG